MAAVKVLADVDTGVDDALALIYLAWAHRTGRAQLLGCGTVAGNCTVEQATANTLRVLELAGLEVPVARGAGRPLAGTLRTAPEVHGEDGLAGAGVGLPSRKPSPEHAVDQILRLSRQHAGELVLVATGPLTNVAMALVLEPELARRLARLVVMGGGVRDLGNVTAAAEFNFYTDPEAAQVVLESGAPLTLVGLDVTHQVYVEEADLAPLQQVDTPQARFARHLLRFGMEAYRRLGGPARFYLHDPLAAAVALDPRWVSGRWLALSVETQGERTRGMCVADWRRQPEAPVPAGPGWAWVALQVEGRRFVGHFMEELACWAREAGPGGRAELADGRDTRDEPAAAHG